jgi:hypothetical protein
MKFKNFKKQPYWALQTHYGEYYCNSELIMILVQAGAVPEVSRRLRISDFITIGI